MSSDVEMAKLRLECLKLAGGDRVKAAGHVRFVLHGVSERDSAPEIDLTGLLGGGGAYETLRAKEPRQPAASAQWMPSDDLHRLAEGSTAPTVAIPIEPSDDDIEAMRAAIRRMAVDNGGLDWDLVARAAYRALVDRHR
ncbi:MAG: hypothetical protein VW338_00160 [Rhodospirillaceae bacterium]